MAANTPPIQGMHTMLSNRDGRCSFFDDIQNISLYLYSPQCHMSGDTNKINEPEFYDLGPYDSHDAEKADGIAES